MFVMFRWDTLLTLPKFVSLPRSQPEAPCQPWAAEATPRLLNNIRNAIDPPAATIRQGFYRGAMNELNHRKDPNVSDVGRA